MASRFRTGGVFTRRSQHLWPGVAIPTRVFLGAVHVVRSPSHLGVAPERTQLGRGSLEFLSVQDYLFQAYPSARLILVGFGYQIVLGQLRQIGDGFADAFLALQERGGPPADSLSTREHSLGQNHPQEGGVLTAAQCRRRRRFSHVSRRRFSQVTHCSGPAASVGGR